MTHMEDVLDLYAEPYDPQRPVVCFDETSTQMLSDTRPPLPAEPGQPMREDYEYRREGTRNLFLACEPLAGWRHVAVAARRTTQGFAHQMRWLVDEVYPDVPVVRSGFGQSEYPSHGVAVPGVGRGASPGSRSFTTRPSTAIGSTWRKSSSAFSPAAASSSVSRTRNPSAGRSTPWNWNETKLKPASTGASASRTPEPNSTASIPSIPDLTEC